jgi:hypothetical protein
MFFSEKRLWAKRFEIKTRKRFMENVHKGYHRRKSKANFGNATRCPISMS